MRYSSRLTVLSIALCLLSQNAFAVSEAAQVVTAPKPPRLTVLFDAFGSDQNLQKDWGYSALVEISGKRILFDTGNDAAILKHNVEAKGIDLSTIDFVILSHRHSDHMGGLTYLLSVNPKVKIYAPKENFGVFGSSLPSTFYRKTESLPPEMRYYDGAPADIMKFGTAWPGANFELIDKTTEISPGITLIALVSDKPGTLELKELSLAVDTPDGVVLIVGCSHPGIDRIVEAATAINKRIHLIAGGLHLAIAPDAEVERLVTALHDTYHVEWVAPGHCTGEPAFAALSKAFSDHYVYAGLGSMIGLGVKPRAALDDRTRASLDQDELRQYRQIVRQNLISFGHRTSLH
jgi:7,8-dihydropterin-6-yl-methyl-4-(beta-D-ribofuranosyl)aminobenzene 5'-phosphate synthase